ncbi:MAG: hypothetical protein QN122_12150 [Armatimonadota bacterium]|nr:hypothetical protein [Armatimonadota bacterium]
MIVAHGHLGGYVEGGDPATWYPELWRWLVETLEARTVIDVGCGEGHAAREFERLGCRVLAIDGVVPKGAVVTIRRHDYTEGPLSLYPALYDLAWSCELVEHVEERYLPNVLATFACARYVAMTHAEPGQPGHHHVNCQPREYWLGAMAAIGYALDPDLTHEARDLARRTNPHPLNHFARSGLILRRLSGIPRSL